MRRLQSLFRRVLRTPYAALILLGFFIPYLVFFVRPVFLAANTMQFFRYVPSTQPIGSDLKLNLSWSESWLAGHEATPADGSAFPPLGSLLVAPLLAVEFSVAYRIVTLTTVLLYAFITFGLPVWMCPEKKLWYLPVVFCTSGLVSYGFQFELERGQVNVIAFALALFSIWMFHRHGRYRFVAYVLFVIAVQLKLFPLAFIMLFVSDWRDWKHNVIRIAMLTATNALLMFIRGPGFFGLSMIGLKAWSQDPYIWIGNPSIRSAVTLALQAAAFHGWVGGEPYAGILEMLLIAAVLLCLFLILLQACRQNRTGLNPYFLLAGAIACLLVPSGGHDYRLALLGAPMVLLFLVESKQEKEYFGRSASALRGLAIFVLSLAYSTTLYSFEQKPYFIGNNFAPLFAMLLAVTYLALSSIPPPPGESVSATGSPGASPHDSVHALSFERALLNRPVLIGGPAGSLCL